MYVLNYANHNTIAKRLNVTQNDTFNSSKTLTVAHQTVVPILQYVTLTLNTSKEDDYRQFIIPFAVTDIKCSTLGAPFTEEIIQNSNIHDFTIYTPIKITSIYTDSRKSYLKAPIFLVLL